VKPEDNAPPAFYAHSKTKPDGSPAPQEDWEPLFTPYGESADQECREQDCLRCENLVARHGHLNKVAFWSARFAAEMFPDGGNREEARQWLAKALEIGGAEPKLQALDDEELAAIW
jgi:hypothetical protein